MLCTHLHGTVDASLQLLELLPQLLRLRLCLCCAACHLQAQQRGWGKPLEAPPVSLPRLRDSPTNMRD